MMYNFLIELKTRNELLFYFGVFNLLIALTCIFFSIVTKIEVANVNAWFKPLKFALSIGIYTLTMAWLMNYLPNDKLVSTFSLLIVLALGFEILYICIQAGRGEMSHFNLSTPFYSFLYSLMAIAATLVSLITLWVAILFFQYEFPSLPYYYVLSIQLALLLFVVFSLEGFVMGGKLSHTIGGPDGDLGIPFLNWSRKYGDPRIAHFIGMHALQILPLLSFYVLKDTKTVILVTIVYSLVAVYVLMQALYGKPLIR